MCCRFGTIQAAGGERGGVWRAGLEGVGLAQDVLDGLVDWSEGVHGLASGTRNLSEAGNYVLEWIESASLSGISMLNSCG